jgi:hypothetical protein
MKLSLVAQINIMMMQIKHFSRRIMSRILSKRRRRRDWLLTRTKRLQKQYAVKTIFTHPSSGPHVVNIITHRLPTQIFSSVLGSLLGEHQYIIFCHRRSVPASSPRPFMGVIFYLNTHWQQVILATTHLKIHMDYSTDEGSSSSSSITNVTAATTLHYDVSFYESYINHLLEHPTVIAGSGLDARPLATGVDADAFAVSLDPAFEFSIPVVQVGQLADGAATRSISGNIPQRETIKVDRRPLKVGLSRY